MKLQIRVSEESREPIYHQIENQVKSLIIGGQLRPNDPLPSIRVLASDIGCSVITTRRAYQNLENNGFIQTIQGKGTFVREVEAQMMEETKDKIVYDGLQKVVEQAEQLGFSQQEIREIFENMLLKITRRS